MKDKPKLTRAFFARHGKQGGLASGERKSRGDREYYAELGRKAAAAKKLKAILNQNTTEPKGHCS